MTDVTDMQTVPAAQPTQTGASGVTTRGASQPAATAARFVCRVGGTARMQRGDFTDTQIERVSGSAGARRPMPSLQRGL